MTSHGKRRAALWASLISTGLLAACASSSLRGSTSSEEAPVSASTHDITGVSAEGYQPGIQQPGRNPDSTSGGRYGTDSDRASTFGTRTPTGGPSWNGGPADIGIGGSGSREEVILKSPVGPRIRVPDAGVP